MRAGRVTTGGALVTLALVTRAAPVAACSCVGPAPDPAAALAQADGAFVGTLVGVDDPGLLEEVVSSGRDVEHRFAVEGVALAALSTPPRVDPGDAGNDRLVRDLAAAAVLSALTIGAIALIEARPRHDPAPPRQPGS